MSQTVVNELAARALPGGLGDTGHDMYIRSYAAEGAGVQFGRFLVAGTDAEKQVALPTASAPAVGCAVHQHPLEDEALTDFADGETVGVLTKGRCWAQAAVAMAVDDTVYVLDSGADAGKATNSATGATALPSSKVEAYDADAALVLLSVNLP